MDRLYVLTRDELECWVRAGDGWDAFRRTPGEKLECVAASRDRPDRVFCGTFEDGLIRSTDGGRSFEPVGEDVIGSDAVMSLAIGPSDSDVIFVGTEPSALYRSTDGGTTWSAIEGLTDVPSASEWYFPPRPETHHVRWIEVDPAEPDRWYVGIEAGALVITPDAGETWVDRPDGSKLDNHTLATHPDSTGRVYSAAGDGYAESTDGGRTWTSLHEGLDHRYVWGLAVDAGDPERRIVSAASGAMRAHRADSAEAYVYRRRREAPWERLNDRGLPMGEGVLRPVLAAGAKPGSFAAASNRGVYLTMDGGDRWDPIEASVDPDGDRAGARALAWV